MGLMSPEIMHADGKYLCAKIMIYCDYLMEKSFPSSNFTVNSFAQISSDILAEVWYISLTVSALHH